MSREVEKFLESDLLEKYLLETTTFKENQQTEHFINSYPEVKAQYIELQENLEAYAASFAVKAPERIKRNLMEATGTTRKNTIPRYVAVAGIVAFLLALSTFYFWDQNRALKEQNAAISSQINQLEENIGITETQLNTVRDQLVLIGDPEMQKYTLTGNAKAATFKALAYVNPEEKTSYVNVINLPELPGDQCYQMWADINGKMISLTVLEHTQGKLVAIPYKENASSYNITIEPKGGSDHATVANLVANVLL
ncbi:MAG: anti-sigma factor [Bacteroidota bacterium]